MKDERKEWLESAVLDYITNNQGVDSVDIVDHFRLRADITLASVTHLIDDGKIRRNEFGLKSRYYPVSK